MQPYFFPYIGYMQLIAQSDVFVFNDDVQYINRGWVNRNRIINPKGQADWLTLPVSAASHTLFINERVYLREQNAARILRRIENMYRTAPRFDAVFPVVAEIMAYPDANVAGFNVNLLQRLAAFLGLTPRFLRSSTVPIPSGLTGQARVIAICQSLGASHYVNPIGGTELYTADAFRAQSINLGFLQTTAEPRQSALGHLWILDRLMYETDSELAQSLQKYQIDWKA